MLRAADLKPPPPPDSRALKPPPRFAAVAFENYQPQHPTQSEARELLQEFVLGRRWRHRVGAAANNPRALRHWWPFGKPAGEEGVGLYLDGGFGVGKTHLLAAAYGSADTAEKRYLSFQELVYLIGVMGMAKAQDELASAELLCVDEFELDDPGNTLIVKTFLSALFERGGAVITTSNTPPEAQGQGRFNAEDFRREIQSLAANFTMVPVDGPDYRHRSSVGTWLDPQLLAHLERTEASPAPRLALDWDELFTLLRSVHPARFGGLLEQVKTVYLSGAQPIATQNDALRFVHFIDKLYDREVMLRASGFGELTELYDASYRDSAYGKKHHRSLSRLSELLADLPTEVATMAVAGSVAEPRG